MAHLTSCVAKGSWVQSPQCTINKSNLRLGKGMRVHRRSSGIHVGLMPTMMSNIKMERSMRRCRRWDSAPTGITHGCDWSGWAKFCEPVSQSRNGRRLRPRLPHLHLCTLLLTTVPQHRRPSFILHRRSHAFSALASLCKLALRPWANDFAFHTHSAHLLRSHGVLLRMPLI